MCYLIDNKKMLKLRLKRELYYGNGSKKNPENTIALGVLPKVRRHYWMTPKWTISRASWCYYNIFNQRFKDGGWRWRWHSTVREIFLPLLVVKTSFCNVFRQNVNILSKNVCLYHFLVKWWHFVMIFVVISIFLKVKCQHSTNSNQIFS